jgi:molybdate transport system substrate-binding protein
MRFGMAFAAAWLVAVGCTGSRAGNAAGTPREVTVFAAASLREVFEAIDRKLETSHPGVRVHLNLAGSQELRLQIAQGARPDLFASADARNMQALVEARLVAPPRTFAYNEPVVVVGADTTPRPRVFSDLPDVGRLVIGTPEVPIGHYTLQILERANRRFGSHFREQVLAKVVSHELNVRQVLAKVTLGEADAGLVYRTDARAAGDKVAIVSIPPDVNLTTSYLIAPVNDGPAPELAQAWLALLLGPEGSERIRAAGFTLPDALAAKR